MSAAACKPPETAARGDILWFQGTHWCVRKKDEYRVSEIYTETQWTLDDGGANTRYLLMVREKRDGRWQESWIVTKEIELKEVRFKEADARLVTLKTAHDWTSAPDLVWCNHRKYLFHAQNTGKAWDDEGKMVTKVTWDYFDETKKHNLAVELWHEPDGVYPEAYDGVVIPKAELQFLAERPLRKIVPCRDTMVILTAAAVLFGLILLFVLESFDYLLAGIVPITTGLFLLVCYTPLAWLLSLLAGISCGGAFVFFGGSLPPLHAAAACLLLAVLIPRLLLLLLKRPQERHAAFAVWGGVLPALWVFSFYQYFYHAPAPHAGHQLAAALLLPLLLAAACYLLIFAAEAVWSGRN